MKNLKPLKELLSSCNTYFLKIDKIIKTFLLSTKILSENFFNDVLDKK